jgi:nucleoside-diphosphate-sugar epimerase
LTEVLVTGAGGLIGGILRQRLGEAYSLRGVDIRRVRDPRVGRADMRRPRAVEAAFEGAEVVIDLAAQADLRATWPDVQRENIAATMNALEAARRRGVRRYIFASSNHVTGMYELDHPYREIVAGNYDGLDPEAIPMLDSTSAVRPDGPYGIGKAFGEAAARYFSDAFGLSVICLRIGSVNAGERPTGPREFATLLTHEDLVRLVDCAIRAPDDLRFGIFYGVSDNTWRFWDIAEARDAIGYAPQDNAEVFRSVEGSTSRS